MSPKKPNTRQASVEDEMEEIGGSGETGRDLVPNPGGSSPFVPGILNDQLQDLIALF